MRPVAKRVIAFTSRLEWEAYIWMLGLLSLAMLDPGSENHFSLCLFKFAGLESCPGCGLGHSISYLFHGEFINSFQMHPLGGIVVTVLACRIYSLAKKASPVASETVKQNY